ncbi:MAG: hypothetical protein Ct9H90mP22_3080 [Gammaproteobacteria bacterium]|nr:MAG: hypothetical protein Ct9H90mP22_3080 [Gammaproteobacteria bacterium]
MRALKNISLLNLSQKTFLDEVRAGGKIYRLIIGRSLTV